MRRGISFSELGVVADEEVGLNMLLADISRCQSLQETYSSRCPSARESLHFENTTGDEDLLQNKIYRTHRSKGRRRPDLLQRPR